MPFGPFQIFLKIRGDIRRSRLTTGVNDTGGNLPPVSTTLVKLVAKFAAGVVETGGKFATGVVDTGGNFAAGVVADTGGQP
jgi:hypothetical protein